MRTKIIKLISLILSLLMLFTMIPLSVSAEGESKTILDVAQTTDGINYYLTDKVTVTATATGTFTGTLDGNGYTVTTSVPLFEAVSGATIQNLTVAGELTGFAAVATLVYGSGAQTTFNKVINKASVTNTVALKNGGITAYDLSKVEYVTAAGLASFVLSTTANFIDCVNEGSISTASVTGSTESPTGSMIGYASGANVTINCCTNTGAIKSNRIAAGMIGLLNNTNATISDCYNSGDVTSTVHYAGGMVGSKLKTGVVSIDRCTNSGAIKGQWYIGGIVGYMAGSETFSIINCGNNGTVTGTKNLGGIVGYSNQTDVTLSVHYCYNVGEVSGSTTAGTCVAGIVGRMDYSVTTIKGCYNNGNITGTQIGQLYWGTSKDTDIGENYYNSAISVTAYYSYTEKAGKNNATSFTADDLASGKLALDMNKEIGKTVYYQNINKDGATKDKYPVTDPTHGYVFENGGKLYSLAFFTLKTASIRLDEVNHGIRFSTAVNKADYAVLTDAGIELTFGTLITPDDYLKVAGYDFTKDKLDKLEFENSDAKAYLDVTAGAFIDNLRGEDNDTYYYFCGSITGIKEGNYDWDYSAIGYITVGNSTVYSCQYATRNAAYVANAALNDTAAGYTDAEKAIIRRYFYKTEYVKREDYINDPTAMKLSWEGEFDVPEEMLDFEEKRQALNDPDGRFMVWSHRGDTARYPQNSIEAVISACMMGVDVCEVDVRVSKDGIPVLVHDETLTKTTNFSDMAGKTVNGMTLPTSAKVSDWTLAELRCLRLKAGAGGTNAAVTDYLIPTLEEAVIVAKGRMFLHCDKLELEYDSTFTRNDVADIAFPIFAKHEAWDTMMYCCGGGIATGYYCLEFLKRTTTSPDGAVPYCLAALNTQSNVDTDWVNKAGKLAELGMPMIARFSGWKDTVTNVAGIDTFFSTHSESLASIKGKIRLHADCYAYENAEAYAKLLSYGVNGAMVNDPLSACQFVADTYYNN